jgi:putative redox protein
MEGLSVTHVAGDRFELRVRGHQLVIDQKLADGGSDQGPTPTELFVASLTACVAFYAERFLARHRLDSQGLRVECDFAMSANRPARVTSIVLRLITPHPLPDHRRAALLAVVDHCTVHNSIRQAPDVRVALVEGAGTGATGQLSSTTASCR